MYRDGWWGRIQISFRIRHVTVRPDAVSTPRRSWRKGFGELFVRVRLAAKLPFVWIRRFINATVICWKGNPLNDIRTLHSLTLEDCVTLGERIAGRVTPRSDSIEMHMVFSIVELWTWRRIYLFGEVVHYAGTSLFTYIWIKQNQLVKVDPSH